MFPLTKETRTK